ncbi:hypothetical protein BDZ85DRAFT_191401 [Elsinoe ampelina]|uniref:Uncharacterized protein n=1 Tax=Elsinoe ampelina TaxID=302913 RepID=A0A6A6GM76_9PEZI|nr:hypothetical protein BDZ85DRAFT_191401 [Elsinoe ampelina]
MASSPVTGNLSFLKRASFWDEQKPYRLRYTPENGFPVTNFTYESQDVSIHSLRDEEDKMSLDDSGFEVQKLVSEVPYADFDDYDKVRSVYVQEVVDFVTRLRGARQITQLRRRHAEFPLSSGTTLKYEQPSNLAHIVDLTLEGARGIIRELYGDQAAAILAGRFEVVTVWKPLRTVTDWPLTMCDARTVDHDKDVIAADAVYEQYVAENAIVHFSPNFRWYFLPHQTEDEILLFKCADSRTPEIKGCPHTAFDWKHDGERYPRESIDLRLLVMFADVDYPTVGPWAL